MSWSPCRRRDEKVGLDWTWLTSLRPLSIHTCAPELHDTRFSPIWKTNLSTFQLNTLVVRSQWTMMCASPVAACFGISRDHKSPKALIYATIHSELTFFTAFKTFDQFCRQTNWLAILFLILFYLYGYFYFMDIVSYLSFSLDTYSQFKSFLCITLVSYWSWWASYHALLLYTFIWQSAVPFPLSLFQPAAIFTLNGVVLTYLCVYDSFSLDEVYLLCLSRHLPSSSAQGINYFWNSFGYTAQEGLCTLDKESVSH